jgi:hypothetical protein
LSVQAGSPSCRDRCTQYFATPLEIVEDQQTASTTGDYLPELGHRIVAAQWYGEPLRDSMNDAIRASSLRQIAEPDPSGKAFEHAPPEPRSEPRLASSTEANYRNEARPGVQASHQLGQRLPTADEGVALGRQAVATRQ